MRDERKTKAQLVEELVQLRQRLAVCEVAERSPLTEAGLHDLKWIRALHAISAAVTHSLDLDEVLESALEKAMEVVGTDAGYVHLFDRGTGRLVLRAYCGISETYAAALRSIQVSPAAIERWRKYPEPAFRTGRILGPGAYRAVRQAAENGGFPSEGYVTIPLWSASGMLGGLSLLSREPRRYSDIELEMLKAIGNEIAVGIENARLYEESRTALRLAQRERDRAQHYLDVAGSMILVIGTDRTVQLANRKACEVLGYEEEEILGKDWFDTFLPAGARADLTALHNDILAGKRTVPEAHENPVLTRSGEERIIVWRNTLLTDESGKALGVLASGMDETERRIADGMVRHYQARLRTLAARLSAAEERERRRLADSLHDRVGQTLAAARIKLAVLREPLEPVGLGHRVDEVTMLLSEAIGQARALTYDLSPPALYQLGLEAALKSLGENLRYEHSIECTLEDDGKFKPVTFDARGMLFQAVRELLTNVVEHSGADEVRIRTWRDDDLIHILVEDNGVGFDPSKLDGRSDAFGLFSIGQRLSEAGGMMEIESSPGEGTRVMLASPLDSARQDKGQL
ncbi:MAG: PAS domain-containing protein [Chloroflexota bacterium]|nr:PAS domain-containing protein [Chloroflexota bacterium]